MQNRAITSDKLANAKVPSGLRGLLHTLFRRSGAAEDSPARMVKVWDARCDAYRNVNLHDRNDPLWPTAREVYLFERKGRRKTAA